MERGDGEVILRPDVSFNVDLADPIDHIYPSGTAAPVPLIQSAAKGEQFNVVGVSVAATVAVFSFGKGVWRIHAFFQGMFVGTSNGANGSGLVMTDPDGNSINVVSMKHVTGNFIAESVDFPVSFQRDGFVLSFAHSATVALDVLSATCSSFVEKVL